MIIGIDHGNKQIKTAHTVFGSGILESDTQPPFGNDIIRYKGKYYSLSEQRIPYMRIKTTDDRFFLLTLYAIAYEINAADAYTENDVICVQLAIGLPPAHFGGQYENFERYFSERRNGIDFEFNRRPYCVCIDDVMCFPQAYAAAITIISQIKEYTQSTIIDLGGFTLDYIRLKNGQPDLSVCDSLEHGVLHMYNTIKSKVNADFDLLLEESDIDAVIKGTHTQYPEAVIQVIERQAQAFVSDLIGKLRERAVDLRNGKAVFVGGGSILLRKYIESSDKVSTAIFVDDVAANVKGYELLYRAYKGKR